MMRVAIYTRLSREDGNEESQSIQYQKELLIDYIKKQGWDLIDVYTDDGYSGTNFDRPDFNRMIKDIEIGKIDVVITKDLSRLGRNYIRAGYYTEEFFPKHNVRYIALNDGYDSEDEDSSEFMPFKNIINEFYAKDLSKKIRFSLEGKARRGEPRNTVFPVFGYQYNSSFERIPDPDTAPIVQFIFKKYIETGSTRKVANLLKENNIKLPRYFNAVKYNYNIEKVLAMSEKELTNWTCSSIRDIIEKEEYLGVYKTAQSKSKSFKDKKRYANIDCYVFNDRYEPLIDRETWEIANRMIKAARSSIITTETNTFKGLLYCLDCGKLLKFDNRGNGKYRYYCLNKECKNFNSISKNIIEKIVKEYLGKVCNEIIIKEKEFLNFVQNFSFKNKSDITIELEEVERRDNELNKLLENLFEQNSIFNLPSSTYEFMLNKYKKEKEKIKFQIRDLREKQQEELDPLKNLDNAKWLISTIKSIDLNNLYSQNSLHKLIKNIKIKTHMINNSKKKRNVWMEIKFVCCNEIILEFLNLDKQMFYTY